MKFRKKGGITRKEFEVRKEGGGSIRLFTAEAGMDMIMNGPRPGRNDLCSCRSGKKYKKCCLKEPSPERLKRIEEIKKKRDAEIERQHAVQLAMASGDDKEMEEVKK
jgi:hypothetical protein